MFFAENAQKEISIHASAKEATGGTGYFYPDGGDFNPRFREGSDNNITTLKTVIVISIHASAKEATTVRIS